ncbi:MAG TPA: SDR family oxidoreductase [Thermoanaerobaculia bacterium]|nr:SDR family oxidoreductase [Thermoanaerobaculia bacterium]
MSSLLTVLVTGANRGIGLALARLYAARGHRVVGTARVPADAHDLGNVAEQVEPLDVTSDESVAALARRLDGRPVDLLIHNAGILVNDRLEDVRPEDVLAQLDTNAVGPLRVTRALRPCLEASRAPKVACLSSVMGSLAGNREGGYYGYRASKAALNAVVRSLAVDLAPIPVFSLHPGYVRTAMTGAGNLTPEESAASLVEVIDGAGREHSGRFLDRHGDEIPW